MEFRLNDDQLELENTVDRYLRDACEATQLRKAFEGDAGITASIWQGLCDLGLTALTVPEDFGGLGLPLLEAAVVAERLGWWAAPGPWATHVLACMAIAEAGDEAQRTKWLPKLATGEIVGTLAFAEGDAWRPEEWTLAGGPRVTGAKDYVVGLDTAGLAVIGLKGGQLGIVDLSGPGVDKAALTSTDRTRPVGRLALTDAPVEIMPGEAAQRVFDAGLVLAAADAQGGSARMVEDIVDYSKTRVQFGKPIAAFQSVKHKLADLALAVNPNAPLGWYAARALDERGEDASASAALAKAHVTDTFADVARTATEAYGGIGYTWEHPAHIWLRRSMFDWAWLGSPSDHRKRYADLSGW